MPNLSVLRKYPLAKLNRDLLTLTRSSGGMELVSGKARAEDDRGGIENSKSLFAVLEDSAI